MKFNFYKRASFKYEFLAIALLITISWVYFFKWWSTNMYVLVASIFWVYMAMNIWANDVANNMWPAVWSKTIGIIWAIIIAWIFEASWALIAGWDVVETIKWWIINADVINWDSKMFIAIMMSTLIWAAIWVNLATFFKAPVSATHSIIWWLIWAWVTASWFGVVDWNQIWMIAASWVVSPLMWWIIAVILLLSITKNILRQDERWDAAKVWVPIYVWIMWWTFSTYLILKWLKQILKHSRFDILLNNEFAIFIWYIIWVITFISLRLYYSKRKAFFSNWKKFINGLFNIPLIFAVSLLSFAHWANDVANAIWPLAAINDATKNHISQITVSIDYWVMILWAIWIVLGLGIFWARLIVTVWWEITKLNQIRAFCVALSAAITVIIASQLWLPVSSTHIALGWIFWVWLLREYFKRLKWNNKEFIRKDMIKSIALAWIITLPMSALISSIWYFVLIKLI
jgi:PiT family inorganic phosphate transporter